ncbi:MAG: phosphoenolpyruvate synthase [Deltaproteobacteria bacterium]|nr:phosphoenolpyruvate synthase [Deltaproteobacteria bacterium]MBW2360926.1 phosphoenolpyruvate synthase [Deltaproteobacteria bacterium]
MLGDRFIRGFATLGLTDVALVGGKNASLGELHREFSSLDVRVPDGFAITAAAYRHALDRAHAWEPLRAALAGLEARDVSGLAERARRAREIVYEADLPDDLREQIARAYVHMEERSGPSPSVAVRSSATAEDLPHASFAGQHDSFLNIVGVDALLEACRRCYASLFTDRAIHYRMDQGFDHFDVAISVGVMQMVRADRAASGVIFTVDTESGFRDLVLITASYGLGENVVQGVVNPDEFTVFKPTFEAGHCGVLRRRLGTKEVRMVYGDDESLATTRNLPTTPEERERFCISDAEVLSLAESALAIERHYSERAGQAQPMDIEWAKDGENGNLYVLQARPETVVSRRPANVLEEYVLDGGGPLLATGRAVGSQVASGRARVVSTLAELAAFRAGEILVTETTSPDWEPVLKVAAGVITARGGRTCHAAIVARELGIPAVVGAEGATGVISDGSLVTLSCAEGEVGRVYAGELPFSVERIDLGSLPRPRTQVMLNLGNPDLAFRTSFLPNDGVGLARMEFIINQSIGIHPMALAHADRVEDPAERDEILQRTRGYPSPSDFFVERLSEGIGTLAAAFYPKPVIVRLSDFKSNEYAALLGGRGFEPHEENPMLGFRGASRYAHPDYADGFALECRALRRVREELGLINVKLMVPFCRRVEEAKRVIEQLARHGLCRGEAGLEIFLMCEIPNNVIQLDAFAEYFDGFSIGSNDLTQLTLGVDRDSEIVAFDFDERDPGVREMIRMAIEGCRRTGRHSGICGQAPSDYPEFCEFLVAAGIDSISLNPDSILAATRRILAIEGGKPRA